MFIYYVDIGTGVAKRESFCDPYIFIGPDGGLWRWNGREWRAGYMTYGGYPIWDKLLHVRNVKGEPEVSYGQLS